MSSSSLLPMSLSSLVLFLLLVPRSSIAGPRPEANSTFSHTPFSRRPTFPSMDAPTRIGFSLLSDRPISPGELHSFSAASANAGAREGSHAWAGLQEFGFNPAPKDMRMLQRRAAAAASAAEEAGESQAVVKRAGGKPSMKNGKISYPPSEWFDINNLEHLSLLATEMTKRMMTWWQEWVPSISRVTEWQIAVLGSAWVNFDIAFGNSANKVVVLKMLKMAGELKGRPEWEGPGGNHFIYDEYIDDHTWWALFAMKGYQAYGNPKFIDDVKFIINYNNGYDNGRCGGGPMWNIFNDIEKNTITTSLHFATLTRLYRFTGEQTYYRQAVVTLEWWLGWALEPETGKIYDTIKYPGCMSDRSSLQSWSYNSGPILTGLADLYYATGDKKLLDLGRTIAYAAMQAYTVPETGIMREACEQNKPAYPGAHYGCGDDLVCFKGIFVMALAEFYVARPDPNIYNFINTQVVAVVWNNIDSSWLAGPLWDGPFDENLASPRTQITVLCLLAAAAIVNVDLLVTAGYDNKGNPTGKGPGIRTNGTNGGASMTPIVPAIVESTGSGGRNSIGSNWAAAMITASWIATVVVGL